MNSTSSVIESSTRSSSYDTLYAETSPTSSSAISRIVDKALPPKNPTPSKEMSARSVELIPTKKVSWAIEADETQIPNRYEYIELGLSNDLWDGKDSWKTQTSGYFEVERYMSLTGRDKKTAQEDLYQPGKKDCSTCCCLTCFHLLCCNC